jgi:hypothetical protein
MQQLINYLPTSEMTAHVHQTSCTQIQRYAVGGDKMISTILPLHLHRKENNDGA